MEITKFSAVTSKDDIDQIREDVRTHRVVVFREQGLYVRCCMYVEVFLSIQ